jgi:hypothetical protein
VSRRTLLLLTVGLLVAALGLSPLLPDAGYDGGRDDRARLTKAASSARTTSPGRGEVTPRMRKEIERVVAAGRSLGDEAGRVTPRMLVDTQVRCAVFAGQRYCLGIGWTEDSEAAVRDRVAAAAETAMRRTATATTGDLDLVASLQSAAARSEAERVARERDELTDAAASVAKVWQLRHEIQGVPLPAKYAALARPKDKGGRVYPRKARIMKGARTLEQNRSWWCGPTAMQSIAWGWDHKKRPQSYWAKRLGTTTDGSSISEIVRLVNKTTGYDSPRRAGPYVVLDISGFTYKQWWRMTKRHIARLRAPIVLHPQLLSRFYPYLSFDASGHFQVGRGYRDRRNGVEKIGFFEPWNQQAFDPGSPYVERVQWRSAYRSFRANKAHPMQNLGL